MRILFDIAHPAHVHLLKNLYFELIKKDHFILVAVKNISSAITLLEKYEIPFVNLGYKSDLILGKIVSQILYNFSLLRYIHKYKLELGFGSSLTLAHVSKLSKLKSIILDDDDDDVEPLFVKFAHPFANVVLSPNCTSRAIQSKIQYNGYHELAYLHPRRFKPDKSILWELGLKEDETFFILRFNAFKAHHDLGVLGLSIENKRRLVKMLENKGRVFITTEREIDPEFEKYKLNLTPEKVHSLIYYSTILIGDSQTMTSEAAVLGTPSIRSNSFVERISYLEEEEHRYGLTFGFKPEQTEQMFAKIDELLSTENLKLIWRNKSIKMISEKIDVTSFYFWFLENFPDSVRIMKETPDFQYKFK